MTDPAQDLLQEALNIVTGARRQAYGNPEDNFATIAALWHPYLVRRGFIVPEQKLTPGDVAAMMVLMKVARLGETPGHKDSWLDIAGYAACGHRCTAPVQQEIQFPESRGTSHGELMQKLDEAEAHAVMLCTCEHTPASYRQDGVCGICGAQAKIL